MLNFVIFVSGTQAVAALLVKTKFYFKLNGNTHTHTHTPRIATVISDKLTEKSACLPNFDYSFHISQMCVYVRARKFAIVCVFSFSVF